MQSLNLCNFFNSFFVHLIIWCSHSTFATFFTVCALVQADISFMRIAKLNKPEALYFFMGCIASGIAGAVQPVFAFLVASFITIFYADNPVSAARPMVILLAQILHIDWLEQRSCSYLLKALVFHCLLGHDVFEHRCFPSVNILNFYCCLESVQDQILSDASFYSWMWVGQPTLLQLHGGAHCFTGQLGTRLRSGRETCFPVFLTQTCILGFPKFHAILSACIPVCPQKYIFLRAMSESQNSAKFSCLITSTGSSSLPVPSFLGQSSNSEFGIRHKRLIGLERANAWGGLSLGFSFLLCCRQYRALHSLKLKVGHVPNSGMLFRPDLTISLFLVSRWCFGVMGQELGRRVRNMMLKNMLFQEVCSFTWVCLTQNGNRGGDIPLFTDCSDDDDWLWSRSVAVRH